MRSLYRESDSHHPLLLRVRQSIQPSLREDADDLASRMMSGCTLAIHMSRKLAGNSEGTPTDRYYTDRLLEGTAGAISLPCA